MLALQKEEASLAQHSVHHSLRYSAKRKFAEGVVERRSHFMGCDFNAVATCSFRSFAVFPLHCCPVTTTVYSEVSAFKQEPIPNCHAI